MIFILLQAGVTGWTKGMGGRILWKGSVVIYSWSLFEKHDHVLSTDSFLPYHVSYICSRINITSCCTNFCSRSKNNTTCVFVQSFVPAYLAQPWHQGVDCHCRSWNTWIWNCCSCVCQICAYVQAAEKWRNKKLTNFSLNILHCYWKCNFPMNPLVLLWMVSRLCVVAGVFVYLS